MGASDALEGHLNGRYDGYVFQGRDMGHISTRQIQKLRDTVAERAGLQETRQGNVMWRKRITPNQISGLISSQQKNYKY